jgi:anti-sigma-K factor RskA
MPTSPVDEHTDEFEQLAGLVALEILDGDELARFEQHAAHCDRCRLMVRLDREALALAAPEMDPSPDFKQRLMERAAQELTATSIQKRPEPIPLRREPPNVIPFWRRSPVASALAAVFALALVTAGAFSYENQVVKSYPLTGSVPGSAIVEVRRSGAAELNLRGLANPPPGQVYEAWIIPEGGKPIPAGVTSSGDAKLPLNGVSNGSTIAITEEPGPVPAPTGVPVLATVVQL